MASLFISQHPLVTEAASHKRKAHCSCALESGNLCYAALKISLLIVTSLYCLPQIFFCVFCTRLTLVFLEFPDVYSITTFAIGIFDLFNA